MRRREIEARRERERMDRIRRDQEIRRHQERMRQDREEWRYRNEIERMRRDRIRDNSRWYDRYDRWYTHCPRPTPIRWERPIRWPEPMPDQRRSWTYADVQVVALNLEGISRDIYDQMSQVIVTNPNQEYRVRLMRVLGSLEDSAENYADAVYAGTDYVDSLNDLFYLDDQLALAEKTLNGYSKAYLVQQEMRAMRYYIDELLWIYRYYY
ncbi:MAG TPA: hypothetical protein VM432_05295 [Bdellovibrionales bacterium]|nr:hypothetical protein [Bdellovibrionales bacterium]